MRDHSAAASGGRGRGLPAGIQLSDLLAAKAEAIPGTHDTGNPRVQCEFFDTRQVGSPRVEFETGVSITSVLACETAQHMIGLSCSTVPSAQRLGSGRAFCKQARQTDGDVCELSLILQGVLLGLARFAVQELGSSSCALFDVRCSALDSRKDAWWLALALVF